MQEARKSLIATAAVVAVIGAAVVGGLVRNRMEIGPGVDVGGPITMESLVSSTNGIPDPSEAAKNPISESTFFYQLTLLLEKEYVDGVTDEQALAIGAVRGMVGSLADSESVFLKPEQMAALKDRRQGLFDGIGVELKPVHDEELLRKWQNQSIGANPSGADTPDPLGLIPKVIVTTVVPGGPADKAGIKVGDRILKVNGKWALSSEEVDEIRGVRAQFDAGKLSEPEFQRVMGEYRTRFEGAMTPTSVLDSLLLGTSGTVSLTWRSGNGRETSGDVKKMRTKMLATDARNGTFALRFFKDADRQLKDALKKDGPLTIDLRQSTMGDFATMRKCLALLAPDGVYGTIERDQVGSPRPLEVAGGPASPRELTLIVDDSTLGAAAVFAKALSTAGLATIEGNLTARLPWIEVIELPDGSGYTLRTGTFSAGATK